MLSIRARALDKIKGRARTAFSTDWLSAEVRCIIIEQEIVSAHWLAEYRRQTKGGPRRARGPGPAGSLPRRHGRPPAAPLLPWEAGSGSALRAGGQLSARTPCSSSRSTTPSCPGTIRPPSCCTRRRSRRVPTRGRRSPSACSRSTTPSCPQTTRPPSSSSQRCSRRAPTGGTRVPCCRSTTPSCRRTNQLPNSSNQLRNHRA
mmetsp:Transcript_121054/g.324992  ORF Transcript_121054/g.324992 Transcript_121054/m.324992 type:complete len:203 (-) Transcript_121054:143-751(-)